jgi:hypothetical protein
MWENKKSIENDFSLNLWNNGFDLRNEKHKNVIIRYLLILLSLFYCYII